MRTGPSGRVRRKTVGTRRQAGGARPVIKGTTMRIDRRYTSKQRATPRKLTLIHSLKPGDCATLRSCLENLVADPRGLPNGKCRRTKLSDVEKQKFISELIYVSEQAAVWASYGALPNKN